MIKLLKRIFKRYIIRYLLFKPVYKSSILIENITGRRIKWMKDLSYYAAVKQY